MLVFLACPPRSVQHGANCYHVNYQGAVTKSQRKEKVCEHFSWMGPGYPLMPKNWEIFSLVQGLAFRFANEGKLVYLTCSVEARLGVW